MGLDVGCEKEVIVIVITGVADDHQEDGESAGDLVPEYDAAQQQTVDGAVAPADVGPPPLDGSGPGGDLRRDRQAGALLPSCGDGRADQVGEAGAVRRGRHRGASGR